MVDIQSAFNEITFYQSGQMFSGSLHDLSSSPNVPTYFSCNSHRASSAGRMESTSSTLIDQLRQPNQEAWSKFVALYTPLIFYWARKTGLQTADAADLVQDVFATLVEKLPEFQYDKSKSFRAWLRTVTLNKWREYGRRRAPTLCQADEHELDSSVDHDLEASWETEYRRYLLEQVLKSIECEFPRQAWQAFQKYAVEGIPVADVAQQLGMSAASVYGSKSRILNRLRQRLKDAVEWE
jgi:RNA polymerase sigma-70 factor (ECF subfamily)